jgi:hypothetical protein
MRLVDWSVPSLFVASDTHVADEDCYLNARDMRKAYDNHNILLARRVRKPVISQAMRGASNANDPIYVHSAEPVTEDRRTGRSFFAAPIWVPPRCFEMVVNIRCKQANTGGTYPDLQIYPVIDGPKDLVPLDTSLVITVDSATDTLYSTVVPVPESAERSGTGFLSLYFCTPLYETAAKGAVSVTDVGRTPAWLQGRFDSMFPGNYVVCDTDPTILPMRILWGESNIQGGLDDRIYLDGDWPGPVPIPGTDTFSVYAPNKLLVSSVCVYPVEITDWSAEREV